MMTDTRKAVRSSTGEGRGMRGRIAVSIAMVLSTASFAASALPVIPNAVGYGVETPAGRGGQVHRVTNLNASGAGSLEACVHASGPRVCVFEVSGTIRMTSDLTIRNPFLTIAGQTAPSPGIMLRGAALKIAASDVLVQHIRVRAGDDAAGPVFSNRDALKIESPPTAPIKNIVVDHCSFAWGMDETVSLWNAWDNVTLSNNIIAEGLRIHSDGNYAGFALIAGGTGAGRLSMMGNLMAHHAGRNPLVRGRNLVFVNNVVYNYLKPSVDLQSENGVNTNSTVVGNVFLPGPDAWTANTTVAIRTGGMGLPSGSKVYLNDNQEGGAVPADGWAVANSDFASSIKASSPPMWPTGLVRLPAASGAALEQVLKSTGARPANRDSVDARVVESVRNRKGRLINCVSADGTERCSRNAGGWPTLAENRRPLTLPADHNQVESSGYTKLELWLQRMAAEVEGRSAYPPAPPRLMSNQ